MGELIVGTRGSALALTQTQLVCDALQGAHPGLSIRVERITTTGDARGDVPLSQLGRGIFVSEIESALREGLVDFAVHSTKDLPSTIADDLVIAAFLPRADARDVVVSRFGALRDLPRGARVGTSSPRRACLLRALRPDLRPVDVRGNVDTRLRKLRDGEFDALILAAAGLIRLGRDAEITEWLDADVMVPSVGQGALAVEARASDETAVALLRVLDHPETRTAVTAERTFLAELGAGCRAAAAAHATVDANDTRITAFIGAPDGRHVRASRVGAAGEYIARALGQAVARELIRAGGARFLARPDGALRGRRVAVTRPCSQSTPLVELLQANGAEVLPCPIIDIAPADDPTALDAMLAQATSAQWIVFTSANAVASSAERLARIGRPLAETVRIAAIGDATAAEAIARFGHVDFMPSRATAEVLARELPVRDDSVVLFPHGDIAGHTLVRILQERGARVSAAVAYRTIPGDGDDALAQLVRDDAVDAVVFTSPSTLRFASAAVAEIMKRGNNAPSIVCIGPTTCAAARSAGIVDVIEARTPATGGIVEALEHALGDRARQLVSR